MAGYRRSVAVKAVKAVGGKAATARPAFRIGDWLLSEYQQCLYFGENRTWGTAAEGTGTPRPRIDILKPRPRIDILKPWPRIDILKPRPRIDIAAHRRAGAVRVPAALPRPSALRGPAQTFEPAARCGWPAAVTPAASAAARAAQGGTLPRFGLNSTRPAGCSRGRGAGRGVDGPQRAVQKRGLNTKLAPSGVSLFFAILRSAPPISRLRLAQSGLGNRAFGR